MVGGNGLHPPSRALHSIASHSIFEAPQEGNRVIDTRTKYDAAALGRIQAANSTARVAA